MTETLIKDSIYKVLSLFKPYGDLFEVCQTPGKYIPRLIFITVTNFQGTTVFWWNEKKRTFLTKISIFKQLTVFVIFQNRTILVKNQSKLAKEKVENRSKEIIATNL